jgi:hypothetical protein
MPAQTEMPYTRYHRMLAKAFWPGFWFIGFVATRKPRRRH